MKKFLQLLIMVWLVLSLPVITATTSNTKQGHFAFSKDGQDITQLSLKPGDSGTFTVRNTSNDYISNFWVKQLPSATVSILNNSGARSCPLNRNAKTTLTAKKSCEVGYKVPSDAVPEYLRLIPLGDGIDNSSTAMLNMNINSKLGHAIFRQNKQPITHLDLNPGNKTTFELYNAGGATITGLRLLGLPSGMTFDSKCSGQSASLPVGNSCTITYNVPNNAKKNTFTLTVTGDPSSSDNSGSAVLTINIIPANTGHFVFLNDQGQHIDSLYLQPGDSGSIKLHNAGNIDITDVKLQGLSQNIYMNCPNSKISPMDTHGPFKRFSAIGVDYGFIYQTRDGIVYVGTEKEGLKKLGADGKSLQDVETNKTNKTNVQQGFMYQTRDGTIYVGTHDQGLKKLGADGKSLVPVNDTNVNLGFMYQTRDGTIYVGTNYQGLKKLGADGKSLVPVVDIGVMLGFMYQTRDGTIYVGTYKHGLKKFNADRNGLVNLDDSINGDSVAVPRVSQLSRNKCFQLSGYSLFNNFPFLLI